MTLGVCHPRLRQIAQASEILVRLPLAGTPVEDLALANHILDCLEGFLERRLRVVAVAIPDVDVGQLEALKARVNAVHDVLARQPSIVRGLAHRPEGLRGDDKIGALLAREDVAEERLGLSVLVDVGGIDVVDPELEGPPDD